MIIIAENKSVKAKERIAEALAVLIKEKQIEDITVAELAQKADVSKSSFYRNFRDIYEVFEYLSNGFVNKVCDVMLALVFNCKYEDLKNMPRKIDFNAVKQLLGFSDIDTDIVNYLLRVKNSKVFRSVVKLFVEAVVKYANEKGLDTDAVEYYTRFIANGIYYCMLTSYIDDGSFEMEFIEILMSFDINELKQGV